jgi:two-component system, cell cycle sensor histidine kinase and response regulator CckA
VVRTFSHNALAMKGYAVRLAANGQEAVEILLGSAQEISLILLDVTMPVMNGEAAIGLLQGVRSDLPIIVSSGYNESEVRRRFPAGSFAGFIQKPYTAKQLLRTIETALSRVAQSRSSS